MLLFLLVGLASGRAQEYEFDPEQFTRKPFSLDGYLELKPSFYRLNPDSPFYKLSYYDQEPRKSVGEAYAAFLGDFSYRKGVFEAFLEPYAEYTLSPFESTAGIELFQGYLALKLSPSLTVYAGKKTLRWGKGYAWSPVAFVERPKNPSEPDLAREGYWMLTADYTKSFDGPLKTFSFSPVVIPVSGSLNGDLGRNGGLNFAARIYVLFLATDIDLVLSAGKTRPARFGLDFSRNLRSNWEIHGEAAYYRDLKRQVARPDGTTGTEEFNAASFLVGLRFLSAAETTYILEYHRNGQGSNSSGIDAFYSFVDLAYESYLETGDDARLIEAAGLGSYAGFSPMKDYGFLRIMQKDPFGILYLNPAATVIVNLADGSASWAPEVTYNGFTNWELRLKAAVLTGGPGDEFREKRNRFRLEFRLRRFF